MDIFSDDEDFEESQGGAGSNGSGPSGSFLHVMFSILLKAVKPCRRSGGGKGHSADIYIKSWHPTASPGIFGWLPDGREPG